MASLCFDSITRIKKSFGSMEETILNGKMEVLISGKKQKLELGEGEMYLHNSTRREFRNNCNTVHIEMSTIKGAMNDSGGLWERRRERH